MKHALVFALLLVGCKKKPASLAWERDPSAAADALFEQYLASTGGIEASQAIRNLRIEASSTLEAQKMTLSMVILEERPDRSRIETTLPMLGTIVSGYADGIAWEMSPLTGPRVKVGGEAEEARRSGRLDLYENWRSEWPERKVTAAVDFAGVPCLEVQAVTSLGRAETMYFAVDDSRWMGTRTTVVTDMGEMPMINEVLEYGEIEGVAMPTVTRQTAGPTQVVTRFGKMEVNLSEFPDLTPPPEILSLAAELAEPDPSEETP